MDLDTLLDSLVEEARKTVPPSHSSGGGRVEAAQEAVAALRVQIASVGVAVKEACAAKLKAMAEECAVGEYAQVLDNAADEISAIVMETEPVVTGPEARLLHQCLEVLEDLRLKHVRCASMIRAKVSSPLSAKMHDERVAVLMEAEQKVEALLRSDSPSRDGGTAATDMRDAFLSRIVWLQNTMRPEYGRVVLQNPDTKFVTPIGDVLRVEEREHALASVRKTLLGLFPQVVDSPEEDSDA